MSKLFSFFFFMFVVGTILCGIGEGTSGIAVTRLMASMSSNTTTMSVNNTADFPSGPDYIWVGGEKILYLSKDSTHFYVFDDGSTTEIEGRGYDGTPVGPHAASSKVMNEGGNIINSFLGYNVAAVNTTYGSMAAIITTGGAILGALPRVLMWDYSFLNSGFMLYLKYIILYPISIGFVATLMIIFIPIAWGIVSRFLPTGGG